MAKKTTMEPAVRYLRYDLVNSSEPGTETSHFLNLPKDLSAVNRRMYRAGKDYHVKKITVTSSNTIIPPNTSAGRFSVSTAADSWVTRGAYKRGFATWRRMQQEALEMTSGNIKGTWDDFKIYLSPDQVGAAVTTPIDNGGNAVTAGEWVFTKMVSPDGTTGADEFHLTLIGNHAGVAGAWTRVGLVKSFGESRATVNAESPEVPGTAADDPLVNVFDTGTTIDEVISRMLVEGDSPPYDVPSYAGDDTNMPKPIVIGETTLGVGGRATLPSFNALCGIIEVEMTSPIPNDTYSVLVELAPGKYRGIKALTI